MGRKHEPKFRLVLTDSKNSTKSGKILEILGNYDSRHSEDSEFKAERITHWMSHGAKATDTVHNLLITKGIISGKKINTLPLKKPIIKNESVKVDSVKEDTEKIEEKTEEKAEEKIEEETTPEAPVAEQSSLQDEAPAEEVSAKEVAPEVVEETVVQ